MPTFIIRFILYITCYISNHLYLAFGLIGLKKRTFGTVVLTSIGGLGY